MKDLLCTDCDTAVAETWGGLCDDCHDAVLDSETYEYYYEDFEWESDDG